MSEDRLGWVFSQYTREREVTMSYVMFFCGWVIVGRAVSSLFGELCQIDAGPDVAVGGEGAESARAAQ